jgi:hypothetical protein
MTYTDVGNPHDREGGIPSICLNVSAGRLTAHSETVPLAGSPRSRKLAYW